MITLTESQFHTNKTWSKPINWDNLPSNSSELVELFDQNGYRLTKLESHYAGANNHLTVNHRHEVSLRQDWFVDDKPLTGPHLNHAYLFERKGYEGEALEQLKSQNPELIPDTYMEQRRQEETMKNPIDTEMSTDGMKMSFTSLFSSITRCSTRPESVINIIIMRDGLSETNSTWRTFDLIIDGY